MARQAAVARALHLLHRVPQRVFLQAAGAIAYVHPPVGQSYWRDDALTHAHAQTPRMTTYVDKKQSCAHVCWLHALASDCERDVLNVHIHVARSAKAKALDEELLAVVVCKRPDLLHRCDAHRRQQCLHKQQQEQEKERGARLRSSAAEHARHRHH